MWQSGQITPLVKITLQKRQPTVVSLVSYILLRLLSSVLSCRVCTKWNRNWMLKFHFWWLCININIENISSMNDTCKCRYTSRFAYKLFKKATAVSLTSYIPLRLLSIESCYAERTLNQISNECWNFIFSNLY